MVGKSHYIKPVQDSHSYNIVGGRVIVSAGGEAGMDMKVVVVPVHTLISASHKARRQFHMPGSVRKQYLPLLQGLF